MTGRSLYQILQVDPQAESEVIEAAYRRLARKYHSDVRGPADAQPRMKEINAAYAVLRHPLHRAAYDRKLWARDMEHGRVAWSREDDVWVACGHHPSSPAAGSCWVWGGALCSSCLDRFQPSTCASCVLASVGQQRADLLLRVLWFLVAFLMVGGFLLSSVAAHDPWVRPSSEAVRSLLISTYLIASVPCGWGLGRKPGEPYYFLPALFGAAIVGPVIAPFRIVKILLWDIRRLGRLAVLVRRTSSRLPVTPPARRRARIIVPAEMSPRAPLQFAAIPSTRFRILLTMEKPWPRREQGVGRPARPTTRWPFSPVRF